jgi:hypothetical protein
MVQRAGHLRTRSDPQRKRAYASEQTRARARAELDNRPSAQASRSGQSQPEDPGAGTFEIICRECGDDPALDYQQVSADLQQIRGPYTFSAGSAAFGNHVESRHGTEEM